jgi:hypothetical protein
MIQQDKSVRIEFDKKRTTPSHRKLVLIMPENPV